MVFTRFLISKTSSLFTNPLPSAPLTICITVTFMFYSFNRNEFITDNFSLEPKWQQVTPGFQDTLSSAFTRWSAGTAKYILTGSFLVIN